MSNTGDSEYRTLLKFLASVKGDSWVVDTALPAFLTPLELRLHDVLVDGYGFHPDQLIWKTPAKTFVSDKARFGRFDRRTLNSELVLLGILDEKTEGVVKHIVLKPGASSDMERLLRHERLPYSKLPDSLNADSADADLRRALFGIVGRHPRFLWNSRLPTPEEVAARAVVSKELTGQAFLDYFEDFTLMLAQEIHDDETRPHKSEDDGYSAEGIAKAKDRIREQNPDYFSHRVFAKPAIRAFVKPKSEALKPSPVVSVEGNPVLRALQEDVIDFLVTSENTKPCFVIQCVRPEEAEESGQHRSAVIDALLHGAKLPSIHIPVADPDRDSPAQTIAFRLLSSLLFELQRRKLLLEEKKARRLENRIPDDRGEIQWEDWMEVDLWADYFVESKGLFRFDEEMLERAHREWKTVKAAYSDAEFKVTESENDKEIMLTAALKSNSGEHRDFSCVRPLVTPGGNWDQFSGITKGTLNNLMILSMFIELKITMI